VKCGRLLAALLAIEAALTLLAPEQAAAQRRSKDQGLFQGPLSVGIRTGRDWTEKAWTIGAQAELPLRGSIKLRPSGDLLFPEHAGMGYQLNGDAVIYLGQGGGLYGGGGAALVHPHGGDTDTGYNLLFGLSTAESQQTTKGFIEFRWTFINDETPFKTAIGFMHRL
jgi:hypothetical protein